VIANLQRENILNAAANGGARATRFAAAKEKKKREKAKIFFHRVKELKKFITN
jgi:hypothetical protein